MEFIKLKQDNDNDISINISHIEAICKGSLCGEKYNIIVRTFNRSYVIKDERYTYDSLVDLLNKEYKLKSFSKNDNNTL